jgi:hypothetical protein
MSARLYVYKLTRAASSLGSRFCVPFLSVCAPQQQLSKHDRDATERAGGRARNE